MPVQPGWTDDRGVYRIHGLLPGDYIVAAVATQVSVAASTARDVRQSGVSTVAIAEIGAATASGGPTSMEVGDAVLTLGQSAIGPAPTSDGRLFVYPTTFHPNTPNPLRATAFAVGSGEERAGIDLHITPVATRRVSGALVSPDGQIAGIPIRMVAEDAEDAPLELEVATTMTSRTGSFCVSGRAGRALLGPSGEGRAEWRRSDGRGGDDHSYRFRCDALLRRFARRADAAGPVPAVSCTGRLSPWPWAGTTSRT